MEKDNQHTSFYQTEKMKSIEKSENKSKIDKNMKSKCCLDYGIPGHTKLECAEAIMMRSRMNSIIAEDNIHCMFK